MTVVEVPLASGSRSEMSKQNIKTETEYAADFFDGIQVGPDVCGGSADLELNAIDFNQMRDFNDININQLLPVKSEPQAAPSSRPPTLRASENLHPYTHPAMDTAIPVPSSSSSMGFMAKVVTESNDLLTTPNYWSSHSSSGMRSAPYPSVSRAAPPDTSQYSTCYQSSAFESQAPVQPYPYWSSPHRASPESLVPAFSTFSCQPAGGTGAMCGPESAPSSEPPPLEYHRLNPSPEAMPEPPAYYQTLSSSSAPSSRLAGLPAASSAMLHSSPAAMAYPQAVGVPGSNYSSPSGSLSELHTLGGHGRLSTSPNYAPVPAATSVSSSLAGEVSAAHSMARPIGAQASAGVGPTYLSQSYPGASSAVHQARGGRNASGSCGNNVIGMNFCAPQLSCHSSPLSQGSPPAGPGCHHSSWSDMSPFTAGYVANGVPSVGSDGETENVYMSEDRTSPLGDSLPGDVSPLEEALGVSRVGPERTSSRSNGRRTRSRSSSHTPKSMELWQFLWVLLAEQNGGGAVVWLDQSNGLFKVINQGRLCDLWSEAKKRNRDRGRVTRYSNLTRTLRYYYQRGLMKKGERDHVYQFIVDNMEPWIQSRARSMTR